MAFQKVNDFKELTLEYSSTGAVTVQLLTDMPGGTLTGRLAPYALPSTTAITITKTITIPLDGIQGTEYQLVVTPANGVQIILRQAKILIRPIGVYLDGSLSEIWQPQPIAVGA